MSSVDTISLFQSLSSKTQLHVKSVSIDFNEIEIGSLKKICPIISSLCQWCHESLLSYISSSRIQESCINCSDLCEICDGDKNGRCQRCKNISNINSTHPTNGYCFCKDGFEYSPSLDACKIALKNVSNDRKLYDGCNEGDYLSQDNICVECREGCKTCDDYSGDCTSCKNFYELEGDNCNLLCTMNCNDCDLPCTTCMDGYKKVNDVCVFDCSPSCIDCGDTGCYECSIGFILIFGDCYSLEGCIEPGYYIQDGGISLYCVNCGSPYMLDQNGYCILCMEGCLECNDDWCFQCKDGYYLSGNYICEMCQPNCKGCEEFSTCNLCEDGYYLENEICSACDPSCQKCNSFSYCTSCSKYHYLNKPGTCFACSYHCIDCSIQQACIACEQKNEFIVNGVCLRISGGCSEGSSIDKCTKCYTGFYLSPENKCMYCPPNCLNCVSFTNCSNCNTGFYLLNFVCVKCPEEAKSCINERVMDSCQKSYYLYIGKCKKCDSNCDECSDSSHCVKCSSGYYLKNAACVKCINGCLICSDSYTCRGCLPTYYLNLGKQCSSCKEGCSECKDETTCEKCSSLYYQYTYNSGVECIGCPHNCTICQWDSVCLIYDEFSDSYIDYDAGITCTKFPLCKKCNAACSECVDGYFIHPVNSSCVRCYEDNCKKCNQTTGECIECKSEYYLSSTFSCEHPGISDCAVYTDISTCSSCKQEYYLSGNKCVKCQFGCLSCTNSSYCNECAPYNNSLTFYQEHNSCIQCPPECYNCTNSLSCTSCIVGYYLLETHCISCSQNCRACIDSNRCTSCNEEYFLENHTCHKCTTNCLICTPYECLQCFTGYIYKNKLCHPNSSIEDCLVFDGSYCLKCIPGYYLSYSTCLKCPTRFCISCGTPNITECLECKKGYYILNGICVPDYSSSDLCIPPQKSIAIMYRCDFKYTLNEDQQCVSIEDPYCCLMYNNVCHMCAMGFYLNNELKCIASCVPNCKICSSPYKCDECEVKYQIVNNLCEMDCPLNCDLCDDSSSCKKCINGFKLSDGICISCIETICKESCTSVGILGCNLCDAIVFINIEKKCQDCYVELLNRAPRKFVYYIVNGAFNDMTDDSLIGYGYSGSRLLRYNNKICSMVFKNYGVIPIGDYKIASIQCGIGSKQLPRVLKLEAINQFATGGVNDEYYKDLYIYPDSEADLDDYLKESGENGIVANYKIRSKLTVGDIVTVVNNAEYSLIMKCNLYMPPSPGEVEVVVFNSNNEYGFKFTNWGGYAKISNSLKYEVCVNQPTHCINICDNYKVMDDDTYILCNEGNKMKLGYFNTGGLYTFRFSVRYKGPNNGLYAIREKELEINSAKSQTTAIQAIQIIREPNQNIGTFYSDIYLKLAAITTLPDLLKYGQSSFILSSTGCLPNFCSNGGECTAAAINYLSCTCSSGFYGITCGLTNNTFTAVRQMINSLSISLSALIDNQHFLGRDQIINLMILATIIPEGLSHSTAKSLVNSISTVFDERWDNNMMQQLIACMNSITTSLFYHLIVGLVPNENLTAPINYLEDISELEWLYEMILRNKAKHGTLLAENETIVGNGITGYMIKNPNATLDLGGVNVTCDEKRSNALLIGYPYEITKEFKTIEGYKVGSSAVGISVYGVPWTGKVLNSTVKLVFNISNVYSGATAKRRKLLGEKLVIKAACYNRATKSMNISACSSVNITNETALTNCSLMASPCFIIYENSKNLKLYLYSILIPGSAIIATVAVILIVKWKKRHTKASTNNNPEMPQYAVQTEGRLKEKSDRSER